MLNGPESSSGGRVLATLRPRDGLAPLLVDRSDARTFFAGTGNSGVLVSHDRAAHWSLLAPGLPLDDKVTVTDLQQDRLNPLRLYATPATGGLWRVDFAPH
jgi:hypothetical protein